MPKIIVADDSRAQLAIYKCMIEEMGHQVFCCKNGQEALDKFLDSGADLMLLDVNMPELDGIQTCRELRKNPLGISVPIIIVSSNDQESDISSGLASGANDYLSKPVKNAELRAKISALLEGSFIASFDDEALEKYQTVVAGRYTVLSRLGSGSHSSVYLAQDEKESGAKVAIKIFNQEVSKNKDLLDAIISRLKDFSALKDAHIIRIFDYGVFQGRPYCVMEYADGGDLKEYSKKMPLAESEAVTLALDVVKALFCLEKNNLRHLDIKPENIMMRGQSFKLADFGIIIERSSSTLPVNAEFWGSAAYMAPEILSGGPASSVKSDIYSLGVTLYQLISGKNPFILETPSASMYKQMNEVPPPLNAEFKSISRLFSDTVTKMLDKNPESRPTLNDLEYAFSHVARKTESPTVKTASAQARKIFDFLCNASQSCNPCLMAGQRFEYIASNSSSFSNRVCCALDKFQDAPSIIQSDYGRRVNPMSDRDYDEVNHLLVSQWRSGKAVSLAWYPQNPWNSTGCVDNPGQVRELKDLMRHGSVPRMAFRKELTRVALALSHLMKEEVPILWKPLPMPNGGSDFWWGSTSTRMILSDDFRALWAEIFDFLVNEKGLKNLIWTYAPSMQQEGINSEKILYPGREYVDIIELEYASAMMIPENYRQIAALGKPVGISGIPHPAALLADDTVPGASELKKAFPKISFLIFTEKNMADGKVSYSYQDCPFFKHMHPSGKSIDEKRAEAKAVAEVVPIKKTAAVKPVAAVPQALPHLTVKTPTLQKASSPAPVPATKQSLSHEDIKERLKRLKELFEEDLISEDEYKQKKAELLKEL